MQWRKSTYCGTESNCLEFAVFADDQVAVRDNAAGPEAPFLSFPGAAWTEFLQAVRSGELAAA